MTLVNLRATPAAKGWVEVWLVGSGGTPSGGLDLTAKQVLLERVGRWQLDAAGFAAVELKPTASITPAGTVYRADFNAGGVQESIVFGGFTGAGPVEATDWIVDVPGALATPALGAHVAAADPHTGYVLESTLGAANGVATLGADAKIPGAQLPSLAIGETFTVASQAAMLALVAQRGDVAVRTDLDPDGFFLLTADAPAVLANWVQITAPGAVTSVDGQVGTVTLSGTYVAKVPGVIDITAGSTAGAGTDDALAVQAAITALPASGGTIRLLGPAYRFKTGVTDSGKCVRFVGNGSGQSAGQGTTISCDAGVQAFTLRNGTGGLGARSGVFRLHLKGSDATPGANDGIRLQTSEGFVQDVMIEGFGGYGLNIVSATGVADATINANVCRVDHVRCYNNKTGGMHTIGTDSNAGTFTNIDCDTNGGWGIHDESSLGNFYTFHVAGNTVGGILISVGGHNHMIGYYESENKPALRIAAGSAGGNVVEFLVCSRPDGADPIEDLSGAPNFVRFDQGGMHWNRLRLGSHNPNQPHVDYNAGIMQFLLGAICRWQNPAATANWTAVAQDTTLDLVLSSPQPGALAIPNPIKAQSALINRRVNSSGAGATTIPVGAGNIVQHTLTGNITDVTFSGASDGQRIMLALIQDATGGRTATWATNVKFAGGAAPALTVTANRRDVFEFYYDGPTGFFHEVSRALNVAA